MKKDATHTPAQKQLKSPKQFEEDKRQSWQRPHLQRLNLNLDTATGGGQTGDGVMTRS